MRDKRKSPAAIPYLTVQSQQRKLLQQIFTVVGKSGTVRMQTQIAKESFFMGDQIPSGDNRHVRVFFADLPENLLHAGKRAHFMFGIVILPPDRRQNDGGNVRIPLDNILKKRIRICLNGCRGMSAYVRS